jgi:hypothetical protein
MVEPNEQLRRVRLSRPSPVHRGEPLSRAELAEAVNAELWRTTGKRYALDAHTIARYERGAVRWPGAAYRSGLRAVLRVRSDSELGFRPTRRGGEVLAVDPVPDVGSAGTSSRPGPAAEYDRRLTAMQGVDAEQGAAAALPGVVEAIHDIHRALGVARGPDRQHLLDVGARAAEFAGFLHRDLGDAMRSLRCHDRAMEWAQEAQNRELQAFVLLRKAQTAYDDRDASRMLGLTRAALALAPELSTGLRAELTQQEARAEAMLGASDRLVEAGLDRARALLPAEPGAGYSAELLEAQAAICFSEMNRPRAAADHLGGVLARSTSERDRAYFAMLMATWLARSGEPDRAVELGLRALPTAIRCVSRRTLREAGALSSALLPWRHRAGVAELDRALDAAATS